MTEHEESRIASNASPAPVAAPMLTPAAWPRILPFAAYVFFIVAGDMLERLGASAAVLRWLYPVKIGVVVLLLAVFWRQYEELRSTRPSPKVAAIAIAAGVAVLLLWISLNADWMIIGSSSGYDPRVDGRIDWPLAVVRILGAALVVPIMEELFWRSFLMRWIEEADFQSVDPAQAGLKSFVITIVLFGFEHNLWLAGVVAGAVYGWLYKRHRTLWSPILSHGVTNGLLGLWVVSTGYWSYW
jgi:CAAX prenyl protease-like protein